MKKYLMRLKGEAEWTIVHAQNKMGAFFKFVSDRNISFGKVEFYKGNELVPVNTVIA